MFDWRKRAEEMRAIAENLPDPESKGMLLAVARAYQGLAERAEQRRSQQEDLTNRAEDQLQG
jgi:hypothetical protein